MNNFIADKDYPIWNINKTNNSINESNGDDNSNNHNNKNNSNNTTITNNSKDRQLSYPVKIRHPDKKLHIYPIDFLY
jgi:hypothetical protein